MSTRKLRKCPHCGNRKGFNITTYLGGHIDIDLGFNGKLLREERVGCDTKENFASCLDCGKSIEVSKLDTRNA